MHGLIKNCRLFTIGSNKKRITGKDVFTNASLYAQKSINKLANKFKPFSFIVASTLLLISTSANSDENDCGTHATIKAIYGVLGYKSRGGICEGLYESKVSADFELVSLKENRLEAYTPEDTINVYFPDVSEQTKNAETFITGIALKPRLYYRMDAKLQPAKSLKWPVEPVLSKIKLKQSELGIFGWSKKKKGTIYIPIRASLDKKDVIKNKDFDVEVIVRTGVNIEKLAWRFLGKGMSKKYNKVSESFPAGDPISIEITWPENHPPVIRLEIAAKPLESDKWLKKIFDIAVPVNSSDTKS